NRQKRLVGFFSPNKYNRLLYNPLISNDVKLCFKAQLEEFVRLYGKFPSHIDGHHHIHLCSNVIIDKVIPSQFAVRRGVSFEKHERNILNKAYRNIVNIIVKRRHVCVDKFYVMDSHLLKSGIQHIVTESKTCNLELSSHPEKSESYEFLMGADFLRLIESTHLGRYSDL
ncbi:MAG: ChbG/HpnK family deacetylase, partial [Pedobacter sp.]